MPPMTPPTCPHSDTFGIASDNSVISAIHCTSERVRARSCTSRLRTTSASSAPATPSTPPDAPTSKSVSPACATLVRYAPIAVPT
jgi:hypothetical protein